MLATFLFQHSNLPYILVDTYTRKKCCPFWCIFITNNRNRSQPDIPSEFVYRMQTEDKNIFNIEFVLFEVAITFFQVKLGKECN